MQRAVKGFMTVCCIGNYREVFRELLYWLFESRLYEASTSIELAVLGAPADQEYIAESIHAFEKVRIGHRSERISDYEFPALILAQAASRVWSGDIYYLHTKGVSHGATNPYVRYWRSLMLHYVVAAHEECRRALGAFDAVGTNWRGNHYSGNFWWARAEHIRRLPDVAGLWKTPRRISADAVWNSRLQCEFWIGMVRGRFRNLGPVALDLYRTLRWPVQLEDIVHELFQALGGQRYLEFALSGEGRCFKALGSRVKHLVSPDHRATFAMDDLDFIAAPLGEPRYDLILIDSLHDEERCLSILRWASERLSAQGVIVVHDSNPPTGWHQRPSRDYLHGSEWTGQVWRAIVRYRLERPEIDVVTVDTDWGCTVLRPARSACRRLSPESVPALEWSEFERCRSDWLNLAPVQEFRRGLWYLPYALGHASITARSDVINALISRQSLSHYLELGSGSGDNLGRVIAPVRHGVDVLGSPTFRCSSDEFFAARWGCAEYDLIFVDALHEEAQCLRDLENAYGRLSRSGFIVAHDANPPTAWHQRPSAEVEPGTDWNGTVWKAIVRFRERHPESQLLTVDVDWGCAVIWRGRAARRAFCAGAALTWDNFAQSRRAWINLHSLEEFRAELVKARAAFDL